jgi:asparagine synthase (glutamine-hydrolysing)
MPSPGVDESNHARNVANSINTQHHVKYLSSDEIILNIEDIIGIWDEPFADSSQIPTYYVAKYAKEYVTVSLSGDGADEFLFGYPVHKVYDKYKRYRFLAKLKIDRTVLCFLNILNLKGTKFYEKFNSLSYLLNLMCKYSNLGLVHSHWQNKFWDTKLPVVDSLKVKKDGLLNGDSAAFDNVGHYDAISYLPNDILVKVDRAAMAVSLESRAPFLDHNLLEFLFRLPSDFLYYNGVSKRIAKDLLYEYLPEKIVNRPKQGFSIPVSYWLRNDLKIWAETIIDNIPSDSDFWDKKLVLRIWEEHLSGRIDYPEKIWNIIVLELFFRRKGLLHYSNKK